MASATVASSTGSTGSTPRAKVVGHVGEAGGRLLKTFECEAADCPEALARCADTPKCNLVELLKPNATALALQISRLQNLKHTALANRRRAKLTRKLNGKTTAKLRATWATWGAVNAPDLAADVEVCRAIARRAAATDERGLGKGDHRQWFTLHCDEYCALEKEPLPNLGVPPPPLRAEVVHCPTPSPLLHVVTYQNGPTKALCSFLRSTWYAQVPVTVLGWQPRDFARATNVFYFSDRVYTYLRYLESCPRLATGSLVLFSDADELLQVGGVELEQSAAQLIAEAGASVVVSAEASCMPARLGSASWEHSQKKVPGLHKKAPRCLNTGNLLGYAAPLIDLLNQTCIPCAEGHTTADIYRLYARAYSKKVERWIYSEQAKLMELYVARAPSDPKWSLDFHQKLFHPNFWWNTANDMRVEPDGRLRNAHTGSRPAFIHYNGDSKRTFKGNYSYSALAAALERRHGVGGAVARDAGGFDAFVSRRVDFLSPLFEREAVTADQVCANGGV